MSRFKTVVRIEPGRQDLVIEREFDAPPERVFRAYTEPALFARWYGCEGMSTRIETFESRDGGAYRFTQSLGGREIGTCRGVFHQVVSPLRIVKTSEFEGGPGAVTLETTRFEPAGAGRTRVIQQIVFQSVADRDRMVESGVEHGAGESHARLEAVLQGIAR